MAAVSGNILGFAIVSIAGIAVVHSAELSPREVQARVQAVANSGAKSCVAVFSPARESWGSGVLVDREKGYIVTAAHVISLPGHRVDVAFHDSTLRVRGRVLRVSKSLDLALLQVPSELIPPAAESATWASGGGDQSGAGAADWCVAFGHAAGYQSSRRTAPLRLGRIANSDSSTGANKIVTTCRLTPGDSGGPLFTLDGQLLAIHSHIDARSPYATHVSSVDIQKGLLIVSN